MIRQLTFENATDLQTRLRLLPRVDEEGIGAVIAAYDDHLDERSGSRNSNSGGAFDNQDDHMTTTATMTGYTLLRLEPSSHAEVPTVVDCYEMDFAAILATIRSSAGPIVLSFVQSQQQPTPSPEDPSSSSLFHEVVEEKKSEVDDESISVSIEFEKEPATGRNGSAGQDNHEDSSTVIHTQTDSCKDEMILVEEVDPSSTNIEAVTAVVAAAATVNTAQLPPMLNQVTPKNLLQDFSSLWTTRVRVTSAQLAADAATLTSVVASAAKERAMVAGLVVANNCTSTAAPTNATKTDASSSSSSSSITDSSVSPDRVEPPKLLDLFLQTSSGALIPARIPPPPVPGGGSPLSTTTTAPQPASPERTITNNSLLLIRKSATEPCPPDQYLFQWYRSTTTPPLLTSPSSSLVAASGSPDDNGITDWEILDGATSAAFQPSATEVGVRLRCIIKPVMNQPDEEGEGQDSHAADPIICETDDVVRAAAPLFNGARQALVRGAQFSGFIGKGNAEGRSFRIIVDITFLPDTKQPSSAITVYQTSGSTSEPIHPEPLVGVQVASSYRNPKDLDLILPAASSLVVGAAATNHNAPSLLSELASHGRFKLQAPNRMARESLLIALGIANYKGRPADLDVTTILHPSIVHVPQVIGPGILQLESHSTDPELGATPCSSNIIDSAANNEWMPPAEQSRGATSSPELKVATVTLPPPPPPSPPGALVRLLSLDSSGLQPGSDADYVARIAQLEQELELLQGKYTRKGRVISELQRYVADAESRLSKADVHAASREERIKQYEAMKHDYQRSLAKAEQEIAKRDQSAEELKRQHDSELASLRQQMLTQAEKIGEMEKSVRSLQNERALLSAAVEARDNKLSKMAALQQSFDQLSSQMVEQDTFRKELDDALNRYKNVCKELEKAKESETRYKSLLEESRHSLEEKEHKILTEAKKIGSLQAELETQQVNIQKLKAERNSYKQKGDSLAKEMARICQEGRTVREVEKMIADDAARRQEVLLLREQKRKALDELQHYRTALEQSRVAQKLAGIDVDSMKVLERNAELERLLAELTEYVNAKEMQLETLRQVNDTLQSEIRDLAKANMSKNDV